MLLCRIGGGDNDEENEKKMKRRELHGEGREQLGHRDPCHGGHLSPAAVTPHAHMICNWTKVSRRLSGPRPVHNRKRHRKENFEGNHRRCVSQVTKSAAYNIKPSAEASRSPVTAIAHCFARKGFKWMQRWQNNRRQKAERQNYCQRQPNMELLW